MFPCDSSKMSDDLKFWGIKLSEWPCSRALFLRPLEFDVKFDVSGFVLGSFVGWGEGCFSITIAGICFFPCTCSSYEFWFLCWLAE